MLPRDVVPEVFVRPNRLLAEEAVEDGLDAVHGVVVAQRVRHRAVVLVAVQAEDAAVPLALVPVGKRGTWSRRSRRAGTCFSLSLSLSFRDGLGVF